MAISAGRRTRARRCITTGPAADLPRVRSGGDRPSGSLPESGGSARARVCRRLLRHKDTRGVLPGLRAPRREGGRPSAPAEPPLQSDTVEYLGVLKSVITASSRFAALEVGAGWGSWIVFGGVAARHRGIEEIRLYGVEADPEHVAFMRRHLQDNGFSPNDHTLIHAAVGSAGGRTRFPRAIDASADWGARPFFDRVSGIDYRGFAVDATFEVEILALKDLLAREQVWDLVHIDVQGTETSLCASAIHELGERVRYLVVGTHSRKIDGDLIDLLFRAGWDLENEKPARFAYDRDRPTLEAMTVWDGTQVWRNPRLDTSSAPSESAFCR